MKSIFSRPRSRHSIAGMRQCPCGRIYSARAIVCPSCHAGGGLTRTAPRVTAVGPIVAFHIPERVMPTYPDWLVAASRECKLDSWKLLCVLAEPGSTPLQRATAKVVLAVRSNEPVPDDVDLVAIRAGYEQAKEGGTQ